MISNRKMNALARFLLEKLHYIGLILVAALMLQAYYTAKISEKTLDASVKQQEALRNVLWANLMMERATVLSLSHSVTGDDHLYERAVSVVESIPAFISLNHLSGSEDTKQEMILEKTNSLRELLEKMAKAPVQVRALPTSDLQYQLLDQIEKIGADLNASESTEWYKLLEHNANLIDDFKFRQREVFFIYFIFACYLVFLGWLSDRKKKAEMMLLNAESRLIEASKLSALGEMAAGVAHEVNNPLAIIHTLSSQLQEIIQDESIDRSEVTRIASTIENTTQRISMIVNGLRLISRDGTHDPAQNQSLNKIITETMALCSEKFKNHGIQIKMDPIPESLLLECRATQIAQVFLNLMNNAHDAITHLPSPWIEITVVETQEAVEVQITDCGSGIPTEIQKKLFQPFFTTKEIGRGTGLGLSISQGIIRSHGGKFSLDTDCKNTRFIVVLPKTQSSRKKETAA